MNAPRKPTKTNKPANVPTTTLVSSNETDPVTEANRAVQLFAKSAQEFVHACELIAEMIDRYPHGTPEFNAFTAVLVASKHLSENEAARGPKSGKLSKYYKIGGHSHVLLQPALLRCVEAGYTIAYQTCLLYEALPGTPQVKIEALIEIVESAPDLSHDYLAAKTDEVRRAPTTDHSLEGQASRQGGTEGPMAKLSFGGYDLILATPSPSTMKSLSEHDETTLFRSLRIHEKTAEDAVGLIVAKVKDLPTIVARLMPCCGFKRLSHVLLIRRPEDADIGSADAVVVAYRGDCQPILLDRDTWLDEGEDVDPIGIAIRLARDAERKLHIFAADSSDGWDCLIGDQTWAEPLGGV